MSSRLLFLCTFAIACTFAVGMLMSGEIRADEKAEKLLQQASQAVNNFDSAKAVELATAALAIDPKLSPAYRLRGRENFRLGKMKESVADFDRYVGLRPDRESRQWERGISNYYAKQYKKGAAQFELYQTFHANDVENSVWRFLCMVPDTGIEKARKVMLPIKNDSRMHMMLVYEMFRGNITPQQVLEAIRKGEPQAAVLQGRLFYAHLYIGLFYEVAGKKELAQKYIFLAADKQNATAARVNRYMWDVARIHAQQLRKKPGK